MNDGPADEWVPPALSSSSPTKVNDRLLEQWGKQPDVLHPVVILLDVGVAEASPVPGFERLEPIPYQPGMFKTNLPGADLVTIAAHPAVEDIVPDGDVSAL